MRLFLLPISTRRTLIYSQRLNVTSSEQKSYLDRGTARAAKLWASWENKDSGWQKKIVELGNRALKRIPYEEWGLKSIPPLSSRRQENELSETKKVEVIFPSTLIPENKVSEVLRTLSTERQALHKSRMIYCLIGMPISAPFALVPIIPNLPFFYLVYRAWSHWRALSGSKHVQFLLDRNLVQNKPSAILDTLYAAGIIRAVRDKTVIKTTAVEIQHPSNATQEGKTEPPEALILDKWNAALIVQALEVPELEAELDRAIWQVKNALKSKLVLKEKKEEMESYTSRASSESQEQDKR